MQAITKVFSDIVKPYIDAEDENLQNQLNINSAVNMLPNTATSRVINGVTFTVNADGSVTASGTATAKATLQICSHQNHVFPDSILGKTVKISGSINTNNAYIQLYDPSTNTGRKDTVFTMPSNMNSLSWNTIIEVTSGTTVNGTFKPMITVASYNGDYVPYAKSNKELTEDVEAISNVVSNIYVKKPRTAYINNGNKSTLTITVPLSLPVSASYTQGNIKLFGFNNNVLIDCALAFQLKQNNTAIDKSKLVNYSDSSVTLDSITIENGSVVIVLGNLTTYVWLQISYGTSLATAGMANDMPTWTFA